MESRLLTDDEMLETKGGEAITLTAVLALLSIGLVAVVCYRLFMSKKGKTKIPGGFEFSWE